MARTLFIGGCPRSGTTLMRALLHTHSGVYLGDERYGLRFVDGLPADAFTPERFFDVRPGDAGFSTFGFGMLEGWRARRKFAKAELVGDKIPKVYEHIGALSEAFPGCHFIFLVRNLYDVACSYEARAAAPEDLSWPEDCDASVAVREWNDCLYALKTAEAASVSIVSFEDFFLDGQGLGPLLEVLGLAVEPDVAAAHREMVEKCLWTDKNRKRYLDARTTSRLLRDGHFQDYEQVLSQPICLGAARRAA